MAFYDSALSWSAAAAVFDRLGLGAIFGGVRAFYESAANLIVEITVTRTMQRAQKKLAQLIEDGGDLRDFREWVDTEAPDWSKAYTELVFRQNVFNAYGKARYEQLTDPDVVEEFPYLGHDAVNDARTRPEHAALDGMAWPRDEFPDHMWSPLDFNCRCETRAFNEDLLRRSGFRLQDTAPTSPAGEGFKGNPGDLQNELIKELDRIREEAA
jgi:SPP1 gp7 family putative phage head morphogenesis protein